MSSDLLQNLYAKSPVFIQNLGVSWYGLKVYWREYGAKFDKLLEQFETYQWYTPAQLEELQNTFLRRLIVHAYDQVPYYRRVMDERKLKPSDITSVRDLPRLPVLTRDMVREHGRDLIAANYRNKKLYHGHTSGTTGSPLELVWDDNVCLVKTVVDWRQKRWAGLNPGDHMAFFLGRQVSPLERRKPPFWRHNWVMNHLFCSSFHLSADNLPIYFAKLKSYRVKAIEGYPSTISILARYLDSRGQTFPLTAVLVSSEPLQPSQRQVMEKVFCCKVFDFYGMAERVVFATECTAHEGKHINLDFAATEILDSQQQPVGPGELGRIVATGLHNFAMPLIRYQTSDVTGFREKPCSCGRPFPLMAEVTTKDEDIVTTADGRYVSSSILNAITHHLTSVEEMQIIQEDRSHIRMLIVRRPEYSDSDTAFLRRELAHTLGDGMNIEIEFVDQIPRTKAGKFRWVISKVPLEF